MENESIRILDTRNIELKPNIMDIHVIGKYKGKVNDFSWNHDMDFERCFCCGGIISLKTIGTFIKQSCSSNKKEPCKFYINNKCSKDACVKDYDDEDDWLMKRRKICEYMAFKIMKILVNNGYCVISGYIKDVVPSLSMIDEWFFNNFKIYGGMHSQTTIHTVIYFDHFTWEQVKKKIPEILIKELQINELTELRWDKRKKE